VVSINRLDRKKIGTVGPLIPGVEVKIAEDGEILIRGPNVMQGYFKNPKATSEVLNADGWFHSGDIGELDAEGFLKITDRKKELIVTSGGKNIAPQPMENELKLDVLIEQVCVVGDARKYLSLLIVPDFLALERRAKGHNFKDLDRKKLVEHATVRSWYEKTIKKFNMSRAKYETIKKFTLLPTEWTIEEGEITPTMKLRRKVIREKYTEAIKKMY